MASTCRYTSSRGGGEPNRKKRMASPSISEISSSSRLALIRHSNNSWTIRRLCSISVRVTKLVKPLISGIKRRPLFSRSEEHTSELQSRENLVCRLLLEKKKKDGKNQL